MIEALLVAAAILQGGAVAYGIYLLSRRQGATSAWLFLLGAMVSMLVWRVVVVTGTQPPEFFNPLIGMWGSTCMLAAMFFFGREVTLRRRAESERDALLESERAARTEAERASRLKDEFLATLSHELRTPLAAILGWCEVMRRVDGDELEVERAIATIERNAHMQARLVDDLLDVTRLQAGALHLEIAPVSLDAPVRAALEGVRPSAAAKALSVDFRCRGVAPVVHGDAGRLQQVASNLLVNAAKFTPTGGRIQVELRSEDGVAVLTVSDTGEGFDGEFLPYLFTRFRQADATTTRRHGGLGLGLSIVSDLVRLHGGQIHAESDGPAKGATFTVRLPLASEAGAPAANGNGARRVAGTDLAAPLRGLRIVVIDDEEDVRSAVARLLEQRGARVRALPSGHSVEAVLSGERPHALLVDIGMPGEDGYSLIRRIRQLPPASGGLTPALSLTAHAREEDRERALAAGFRHHLPKPIDVPALVAALIEATSNGERPEG